MIHELLEDNNTTTESNYPIEQDDSFTPDEQEGIKELKQRFIAKRKKNESVLKGLEVSFWGITSYSLARFLVLTSGTNGLSLAIAAIFVINNITNRDCLDSINIDYQEGFKTSGMGKLIKFGLSTLVSAIVIWSAVGDLLNLANSSKQTYNNLEHTVEEFNRLPEDQQNKLYIIGGIVLAASLYVVVDSRGKR